MFEIQSMFNQHAISRIFKMGGGIDHFSLCRYVCVCVVLLFFFFPTFLFLSMALQFNFDWTHFFSWHKIIISLFLFISLNERNINTILLPFNCLKNWWRECIESCLCFALLSETTGQRLYDIKWPFEFISSAPFVLPFSLLSLSLPLHI